MSIKRLEIVHASVVVMGKVLPMDTYTRGMT